MEFINTKQADKFNSSSAKKVAEVSVQSAGWEGFTMKEDPMANLDNIASGGKKYDAMTK